MTMISGAAPPNWAGFLLGRHVLTLLCSFQDTLGASRLHESKQDDANPDFVSLVCQFAHHESGRSYSD